MGHSAFFLSRIKPGSLASHHCDNDSLRFSTYDVSARITTTCTLFRTAQDFQQFVAPLMRHGALQNCATLRVLMIGQRNGAGDLRPGTMEEGRGVPPAEKKTLSSNPAVTTEGFPALFFPPDSRRLHPRPSTSSQPRWLSLLLLLLLSLYLQREKSLSYLNIDFRIGPSPVTTLGASSAVARLAATQISKPFRVRPVSFRLSSYIICTALLLSCTTTGEIH